MARPHEEPAAGPVIMRLGLKLFVEVRCLSGLTKAVKRAALVLRSGSTAEAVATGEHLAAVVDAASLKGRTLHESLLGALPPISPFHDWQPWIELAGSAETVREAAHEAALRIQRLAKASQVAILALRNAQAPDAESCADELAYWVAQLHERATQAIAPFLYPIIFSRDLRGEVERVATAVYAGTRPGERSFFSFTSEEVVDRLAVLRLELEQPSLRVRDILRLRHDEVDVREYLALLAGRVAELMEAAGPEP